MKNRYRIGWLYRWIDLLFLTIVAGTIFVFLWPFLRPMSGIVNGLDLWLRVPVQFLIVFAGARVLSRLGGLHYGHSHPARFLRYPPASACPQGPSAVRPQGLA